MCWIFKLPKCLLGHFQQLLLLVFLKKGHVLILIMVQSLVIVENKLTFSLEDVLGNLKEVFEILWSVQLPNYSH